MGDIAKLTREYDRDGLVRIPGFLSPAMLTQVRARLEHYIRMLAPHLPTGDRTFEADGTTVRNLWRMENHDPYFKTLAEQPDTLSLAAALVHGEPVLMGVETFNKPAKVGSGVPPHQDNAYFCQSPPDALTIWIAIDAATVANGPICYLKGSHVHGVLEHRPSGVAGNSMGLARMPEHADAEEVCGLLDPGDAMIHHCQTIHWSAANETDKPRCALLLVYRAAHTTYDASLKARYDAARGLA